jgi:hypothetical protein
MLSKSEPNLMISNVDIYTPVKITAQSQVSSADFAILELDCVVKNRAPLKLRKSGSIANHDSVYIIGHPCGLPLKFAGDAWVRDNAPQHYFTANLDAFGGNSGSPVFSNDGVVEGILVRGETDFVRTSQNCYLPRIVPSSGPTGEECNRITDLAPFLAR